MKKLASRLLSAITISIWLAGCTTNGQIVLPGPGGGGAAAAGYFGAQNPGDVWNWSFNHTAGTFTATNKTKSFTYSGSFTTLSSGYLKLQVTATTDPSVTTPATAYALEIPNTALLVMPPGQMTATITPQWRTNLVIAGSLGPCPSTGGPFNTVAIPTTLFNATNDTGATVTTVTVSGGSASGASNNYKISGASNGTGSFSGFTCSNGVFTKLADPMTLAFTPSGTYIADLGGADPSHAGFVGTGAPGSNVAFSSLTSGTISYRGFGYHYADELNGLGPQWYTMAIGATPSGTANQLSVFGFTNIDTGAMFTGCNQTITLNSQPSSGLILATYFEDTPCGPDSQAVIFSVSQVNGKFVLWGIDHDLTITNNGFLFMLLQQ